jgi:hypothetical protein
MVPLFGISYPEPRYRHSVILQKSIYRVAKRLADEGVKSPFGIVRNLETGDRMQEKGNRKQESGDRIQESGNGRQDSGIRRQEIGFRNQETGNRIQESGNSIQETGFREKH